MFKKNLKLLTLLIFITSHLFCQQDFFGEFASATKINNNTNNQFYNTSGFGVNQINPSGVLFNNQNLGTFVANSSILRITGTEVKTFKSSGANVCGARLFYTVYPTATPPSSPVYTMVNIPFKANCNTSLNQFDDLLGPCTNGDQKWSTEALNINLTNRCPGNYTLEIYYEYEGSTLNTSSCGMIRSIREEVGNFKAFFNITSNYSLNASATNTSVCAGQTISLTATTSGGFPPYTISWTGPNSFTSSASNPSITNATTAASGTYNVTVVDGCGESKSASVNVTVNPLITPNFNFGSSLNICSGGTVPTLPTSSTNGVNGTWSSGTVSNTSSGTYTFTPGSGQCATTQTFVVTVNPNIVPTFSFGNTLSICNGTAVPALPVNSTNGINGTWSPATVSNTASATYTFTPNSGQCATTQTFAVTVNPNIVPTFSFGNNVSICSGANAPTLPNNSGNNISGTWSPATVSNTVSGTYTFTPNSGQCATTRTLTVTVNPNVVPTFSFGNNVSICSGANAPTLPNNASNNISGTWSPATVSNTASGIYTFTPNSGQCATPFTLSITVNPLPVVNAGPDKTILSGNSVTLDGTASNYASFNWNNNVGNSSLTPIVSPATTTTYTLTATSAAGCTASDNALITVIPYCIEIMKAFTPNGDGQYDQWKIYKGTNCTKKVAVKVFNRYGGLVYENANYQNNWDGTYGRLKVTDATYYYLVDITLLDDRRFILKGDVTIIR